MMLVLQIVGSSQSRKGEYESLSSDNMGNIFSHPEDLLLANEVVITTSSSKLPAKKVKIRKVRRRSLSLYHDCTTIASYMNTISLKTTKSVLLPDPFPPPANYCPDVYFYSRKLNTELGHNMHSRNRPMWMVDTNCGNTKQIKKFNSIRMCLSTQMLCAVWTVFFHNTSRHHSWENKYQNGIPMQCTNHPLSTKIRMTFSRHLTTSSSFVHHRNHSHIRIYNCRIDEAFPGLPGFRCVIDDIIYKNNDNMQHTQHVWQCNSS